MLYLKTPLTLVQNVKENEPSIVGFKMTQDEFVEFCFEIVVTNQLDKLKIFKKASHGYATKMHNLFLVTPESLASNREHGELYDIFLFVDQSTFKNMVIDIANKAGSNNFWYFVEHEHRRNLTNRLTTLKHQIISGDVSIFFDGLLITLK